MNSTLRNAWGALVLVLGVLVLAGTALAENGGGNGNGNGGGPPATPPGQAKKEDPPAPAAAAAPGKSAAAPGQAKKAAPNAAAASKARSAAKPSPKPKANPKANPKAKARSNASTSRPRAADAPAPKITICHRTGSETNPWVQITISENGLNGHERHGDLIPAPASGCPAAGSTPVRQDERGGADKVTICHATGSATNPYVEITIARAGWENGHSKHEGDINPVPAGGCPTSPNDVQREVRSERTTTTSCPATGTRTEQVLVGVWHKTSSEKNPYVFITPSAASAHVDEHADDIPVYATRTIVVETGETCDTTVTTAAARTATSCPANVETRTERVLLGVWHKTSSAKNPYVFVKANEASAHYDKHVDDVPVYETRTIVVSTGAVCATTLTPPPSVGSVAGAATTGGATPPPPAGAIVAAAQAGQPNAGGVAGVTATLPKPKEAERSGGVLGTTKTLAQTAVRERLPFTGLPLWTVALGGVALVAAGLLLRRRSHGHAA